MKVIVTYKSGREVRKTMTISAFNILKEENLRNENIEDTIIDRKRK